LPVSPRWSALVYLGSAVVLGLLPINIWNEPVSTITGRARSPLEVIDVLILVPILEEFIFRGILWSLFERLSKNRKAVTLAVTSLLFGIEHVGYWVQVGLPLPLDAFIHALSMMGAGICFGIFRWHSRSLAVPMTVHMLANSAVLLTQ
jgi:membrane protease YdiL (CAAX protease family)